MEYVLKTNALARSYGDFHALSGLNMSVPKGAIYGFVGKNGAGKTTLMRLVCGLQEPTGGSYTLYGKQSGSADIALARKRIGAVVETPSIYLDMTARDNIIQQYRVLGIPSDNGADELLELVGLHNTGKKKARHFSLGMRQRLGIAVALAGNPDLLVLDEPINGLDPQGIIEVRELIIKLNREKGITVIISSHILDELSRLATHYGFIDGGRMVREMSADELERASRKSVHIKVSDAKALALVLDEMGADYKLVSDTEADIYADVEVTPLVLRLHDKGCTVFTMTEQDESLEGFFMELVGGAKNE